MIKSYTDYLRYLKMDAAACDIRLDTLKQRLFHSYFDELWRFHRLLRRYELLRNKPKNVFVTIYYQFVRLKYKKISIKLGFSIPPNVLGAGCFLPHYGMIIINGNSRIGQNCLIHAGVVIGANGGSSKAPIIGDNVFIGPGAKIYGDISIANGVYVGANSVVNKSIIEPNSIYAGVPAKLIKIDEVHWWKKNRLFL